jgi:hypothetical protein
VKKSPTAVILLLAATACGDGTGPGVFDPVATGQKIDAAMGALGNPAVQSVDVLAGGFTFSMTAPPFPATAAATVPAGIIPCTQCLGRTFAYSTQAGRYQATDATGTPTDVVRYLLYAVNPTTRTVITPLQQVGVLDLADKAGNTLGVKAVVNNVTVLDYNANASITTGNFLLTAKGYVTGGNERLDFDLTQSVNVTSNDTRVDYKITSPTQNNMQIDFLLTGKLGGAKNATLTVTEGSSKLEITANGTAASSTGTVKLNGSSIATLTDTDKTDPVFTASGSRILTPAEIVALVNMFNRVDVILAAFDDLLVPAFFVFGITR